MLIKFLRLFGRKKRLSEQNDELLWLDYLLYIAFFLIGLLLLCLLEFAQGKEGGYEFIKAGIGIFIGIFIIIVVVIGVNCFRKPRVIKFEETVYKKLKEYFDKENETVYKDINMVWVVQERCFWLELYLDRDFIRHF